jgi:SAM-dependent methyltransferase
MNRYEPLYSSGGFGYTKDRAKWVRWVKQHYVERFALAPRLSLLERLTSRRRAGPKLLDVPCGDGFWTSVFAELGFDACGVDLSPAGVEAAKKSYPGLRFYEGNAEEPLPVPEASFDIVFSRGISHLHHKDLFRDASKKMARNLMRYVKPKGILLVSYYSKRDKGSTERHYYHPVSDMVRLFEEAGDVRQLDVVNNFVQIGVWRRDK